MSLKQSSVTVYTTQYCPFCHRAKHLLDSLEIVYEEIPVDGNSELRAHMESITGGYTVPQLIIDGKAIGGCDDLYALHKTNQLNEMIFFKS